MCQSKVNEILQQLTKYKDCIKKVKKELALLKEYIFTHRDTKSNLHKFKTEEIEKHFNFVNVIIISNYYQKNLITSY